MSQYEAKKTCDMANNGTPVLIYPKNQTFVDTCKRTEYIWRSDDRVSWYIRVLKPTKCTNSQIYFWNKTLHVSDSSSVHHRKFFTVHTVMVYVIQVCWQLAGRIRMELHSHPDPAHKLSADLYNIYHCCVYSEKLLMMDTETVRNM